MDFNLVIEHAPHAAVPSPSQVTSRANDRLTIERSFEALPSLSDLQRRSGIPKKRRRLLPGIAVGAAGIALAAGLLGNSTDRAATSPGAGSLNEDDTTRELSIQNIAWPAAPAPMPNELAAQQAPAPAAGSANHEAATLESGPKLVEPAVVQLEPAVRDERLERARRRAKVRAVPPPPTATTPSQTSPTATPEDLDSPFPK